MLLLALLAALLAGCGARDEKADRRAAADGAPVSTKTGIDAMNDVDRFFYAHSFTTIATVPYGRCWPESLFKILSAGIKHRPEGRFARFAVPKMRFKQNDGYAEWLRVKAVVVERATRRVVSAEGRAGPFASDAALQAYLDSEVRTELNSSIVVVKDETAGADGEMRFVCASKHGGSYTLRIILREESPTSLWLDVVAMARGD